MEPRQAEHGSAALPVREGGRIRRSRRMSPCRRGTLAEGHRDRKRRGTSPHPPPGLAVAARGERRQADQSHDDRRGRRQTENPEEADDVRNRRSVRQTEPGRCASRLRQGAARSRRARGLRRTSSSDDTQSPGTERTDVRPVRERPARSPDEEPRTRPLTAQRRPPAPAVQSRRFINGRATWTCLARGFAAGQLRPSRPAWICLASASASTRNGRSSAFIRANSAGV